ncbi:RING-type E3 ubiquitin transferase [Malassezia sp. CBS 17886]|nr:RING-type E3 ubiquitin transferase [Malassezia sp. CBS 17886]
MPHPPSYHVHITQYAGGEGAGAGAPSARTERDAPRGAAGAGGVSRTDAPSPALDARLGRINLHAVAPRHAVAQRPRTIGLGAFEPIDSFPVDTAAPAEDGDVVRVAFGIVHLFRTPDEAPTDARSAAADAPPDDESVGTVLGMLTVPMHMSIAALMDFIDPATDAIQHVRLLSHADLDRRLVLLKFRESVDAEDFFKMFHGQPFSAADLAETCNLVYVTGVTVSASPTLPHAYPLLSGTEPWPVIPRDAAAPAAALAPHRRRAHSPPGVHSSVFELPSCAVCLDRLDSGLSGLVTVLCQHTFHCACLRRWQDSRCPVCRYTQTDEGAAGDADGARVARATACRVCGTHSDLWVCLICANVGCGRYHEGHAQAHYQETAHLYSLELETQRVWDYAGDGYVHRLIQSKSDGKLVELPSASGVAAATPGQQWNDWYPRGGDGGGGDADARAEALLREKTEALGMEYSNLITSQLDSQRAYYERHMARLQAELTSTEEHRRVCAERDALRHACTGAQERAATLERDLDASRAAAAKHESLLRRALDTAKDARRQYDEEKSVSDGLFQHVQKLKGEQTALRAKVAELSDELRDLMFFVSARDKVEEGGSAGDSMVGGDVQVPDAPAGTPRRARRRGAGGAGRAA